MTKPAFAKAPAPVDPARDALFRDYLNVYWLRPETAGVLTLRHQMMAKAGYDRFEGPVTDISCGDGIYAFMLLGGRLEPSFDVHVMAENGGGDLYDRFGDAYAPKVAAKPRQTLDVGLDWKPNLLRRAETLGVYGDLREADVMASLPVDDASMATVMNIAAINHYPHHQPLLSECRRILKPGGTLAMLVQTQGMVTLYKELEGVYPQAWLERLERGMRSIWPLLYTWQAWRDVFTEAGFTVEAMHPAGSVAFARTWNIGFRPLAGPLTRMKELARKHDPKAVTELKADWADTLATLLAPLLVQGETLDDAAEILYVLRRPE